MLIQQPLEHISQLVLVHCVAPLVEQGAQEVPAAGLAAGEAAAAATEVDVAGPSANWPPGLEEAAGAAETSGEDGAEEAAGAAETAGEDGAEEAEPEPEAEPPELEPELPELEPEPPELEPEPPETWPGTASSLLPPKMDMDCLRSGKLLHWPLFWAPEMVTGAQFIYVSPVVLASQIQPKVAVPSFIAGCMGTLKARMQPVSVESGSAQWLLGASG
jgi:hypothetical protein